MINLTQIIIAIITLLFGYITKFVTGYLKEKTSAKKYQILGILIDSACSAAEQIYDSDAGWEKKNYVLNYLQGKGYDINSADVENAVEAAVLNLHNALYTDE